MKRLLVVLAGALVLWTSAGEAEVKREEWPLPTRHFATERVLYGEEDTFLCTGFWIGPALAPDTYVSEDFGWLVTAGHCARDATRIRTGPSSFFVLAWRGVLQSRIHVQERHIDLALAAAGNYDGYRFPFAERNARPGDKVRLVGFKGPEPGVPAGDTATVVHVEESYNRWLGGAQYAIPDNFSLARGSSGSPVLNEKDELVGVFWGVKRDPGEFPTPFRHGVLDFTHYVFTPVSALKDLIRLMGIYGF